jgi:site-specific recombinase XerD
MKELNPLETWLQSVALSHSKSQGTAKQYTTYLNEFCRYIEATPQQVIDEYEKSIEKHEERLFKRKFAEYLRGFMAEVAKTRTSATTYAATAAVKSFFKYMNLEIDFVPKVKVHASYHNRDITKDEIKAILDMSAPRERAFYSMMVQGGLRPDTLCKIKLKDLEPDFAKNIVPCKVTVNEQNTKGQTHSYFTFIGPEAVEYLRAYLSTRANTSKEDYVFCAEGLTAPASATGMSNLFRRAIRKLREKKLIDYELRYDKPSELRLYNLRKYFSFNASAMGTENKEFILGHMQGVRDHYLSQDVEHYRQLYADKALPNLRLATATALEYEKEAKAKDQEIATLRSEVSELRDLVKEQTEAMRQLNERMKQQEQKM